MYWLISYERGHDDALMDIIVDFGDRLMIT